MGFAYDLQHFTPVRTSRNFFRLGSAFLEGEMAEPSLKMLREVRTGMLDAIVSNRLLVLFTTRSSLFLLLV